MELSFRSRREVAPGSGRFAPQQQTATWASAQTAAIICDMWDTHWSRVRRAAWPSWPHT